MSYALGMTSKRPTNMAELFKAIRASRDLTQGQLAKFAKCSDIYIGHIEQGKYPRPVEKLSKIWTILTKEEKDLAKEILVKQLYAELEG